MVRTQRRLQEFECKLIALRTISENRKGKFRCVAEDLKKLQNTEISILDISVRFYSATDKTVSQGCGCFSYC